MFVLYFKGIPLQEPTTIASNIGDVSVHGRVSGNATNSRVEIPSTSQCTPPVTSSSHVNTGNESTIEFL